MKTIILVGEKGSKSRWYVGYARVVLDEGEIIIEVRRWSYWCKEIGIKKATALLKKKEIRRLGGVYSDLHKSYSVKRFIKEILFVKKQKRKSNSKIR